MFKTNIKHFVLKWGAFRNVIYNLPLGGWIPWGFPCALGFPPPNLAWDTIQMYIDLEKAGDLGGSGVTLSAEYPAPVTLYWGTVPLTGTGGKMDGLGLKNA